MYFCQCRYRVIFLVLTSTIRRMNRHAASPASHKQTGYQLNPMNIAYQRKTGQQPRHARLRSLHSKPLPNQTDSIKKPTLRNAPIYQSNHPSYTSRFIYPLPLRTP
jgi:hypothetical protein